MAPAPSSGLVPDPLLGSHTAEDDDNAQLFSAVLSALDREQLPLLAQAVLQQIDPHSPATQTTPSVGDPLYGSYHVLFPLTFHSGLCWVVKIPITGTDGKWNDSSASALASEANTMRILKRQTTIPLPDVLDFSPTTKNDLQCPYIMMTFIPGISLYDMWFGHHLNGVSREMMQSRRRRALEDIAAAMVQLDRFAFQAGGSLVFDKDENVSGVGPVRRVDHKAMLDRWFVHKDPDDDPIYVEFAVSEDPKRHYTMMLDMHPEQVSRGLELLLLQLISWIPEPGGAAPFVLAHPDFDIQNFIVSEDGELQGIIDWDGVAAVPRTLGNERYPGWLTRDWDPAMYAYEESMDQGVEPEGVWEDSPTCLASCRCLYDEIMLRYCADRSHDGNANFCRMSLITENLAIAANNPQCTDGILGKIVGEIWAAVGQDRQLDVTELAIMFADDDVDSTVLETLRKGFAILLSKKGL